MRGRVLTVVGVLATLSVISVPAQQIAPAPKIQILPPGVLPGTKLTAFASVQGVALSAGNKVLAFRTVQLRDARTGRIVRTLQTDEEGHFVFQVIDPGSYVVELLLGDGRTVVATSALFHLNASERASAQVREPLEPKTVESIAGFAGAHAATVAAAAAATGILGSQAGPDVSPR